MVEAYYMLSRSCGAEIPCRLEFHAPINFLTPPPPPTHTHTHTHTHIIGYAEEPQLPYHDAVPVDPTFEDMKKVVVIDRRRPDIPNTWSQSQVGNQPKIRSEEEGSLFQLVGKTFADISTATIVRAKSVSLMMCKRFTLCAFTMVTALQDS